MRVRPNHRPEWSLEQVAHELGAATQVGSASVSGLSLATAEVQPGDLFAALPGATTHGVRFVDQAFAAGAVAVLTDPVGAQALPESVPRVVVAQPLWRRLRPSFTVTLAASS